MPDALRIESATTAFTRAVAVSDERPGQTAAPLGAATVVRLSGVTGDDTREVPLRAARGDRLRVAIDDGDSPSLADLRVVAVVRQPTPVFALDAADARRARPCATAVVAPTRRATTSPGDASALARLDGTRAAIVEAIDGAATARAELSAARDNPAYDGAPALSFAMRPGATLDPRGWTHRRRIVVADSPDGLTRLRLAPSDLVPARADLADVRIVDAQQQQWPYLLQPDAARSWQALGADAPKRERGTSTYELHLPVTPMAVDQLLLDGDAAFVDRAFRLTGHTAAGVDVPLADGRLTIRGERPEPLTIGFPAQRLTALELQVDDGDESALSWRAVRARAVEPELFLVAPAGIYTLLIGNRDAAPPRYELERVRDVVLAVRGGNAAAEPLEANPRYSLGAHRDRRDRPPACYRSWPCGCALAAVGRARHRHAAYGAAVRPPSPTTTDYADAVLWASPVPARAWSGRCGGGRGRPRRRVR